MKWFVISEGKIVKTLESEPSEPLIQILAVEFGNIQIEPEFIEEKVRDKTADEQAEQYLKSALPPGVKTRWKK